MRKNFLKRENMLIAHRGLYNNEKGIIENTLQAFEKAVEYKYIIELDVQIIKNNTVVVYHDDNLIRLSGINKKIKELNYGQLKQIKLCNTDSYIPTLEETLQLVNGKVPILIELKNNGISGKLEKMLAKILKQYKGEYAIQSFNPLSLMRFKVKYPQILRGQIVSQFKDDKINFIKKIILTKFSFASLLKLDFLSLNIYDMDYDKIEYLKQKYVVLGWTVKNVQEYEQLKENYDNLICEQFIYPN